MLNMKKLLIRLLNKTEFITEVYEKSNFSISGNNTVALFNEQDISVSGYKAVGVVGITPSGNGWSTVVPIRFRISNQKLLVTLRNVASSSVTVSNYSITVLYQKL